MSFQDVGRNKRQTANKGGFGPAPSSGNRIAAASSAAAAVGGGGIGGDAFGYEQLSDLIVQFQRNVGLLEKMARSIGTPRDTSVLQTQYQLQSEIINQLSTKISNQLTTLEQRLSTLPRTDATPLRSTHVKLSRDYALVQQKYRMVLLDVKKRRSLMEVKRDEEDRRLHHNNSYQEGNGMMEGVEKNEEIVRRQMQIQEDRINEEIMREREEEIRNIHKGMHQVNEIYKDLANLVDNQQEGIDQIETQMEGAKDNTATGLKHIEKANEHQQSNCVVQ